jgi:hypothetical protein
LPDTIDPDGDTVTISSYSLGSATSFTTYSNGVFTMAPKSTVTGTYTVSVTIVDSGSPSISVTYNFNIVVKAASSASSSSNPYAISTSSSSKTSSSSSSVKQSTSSNSSTQASNTSNTSNSTFDSGLGQTTTGTPTNPKGNSKPIIIIKSSAISHNGTINQNAKNLSA